MIAGLKLEIALLRREQYGQGAERTARLIDQLELQLEELVTDAAEDRVRAEKTTKVASFDRRKPVRKPFPEHLPRERVVVPAPTACACCGPDRIVKTGEVEEDHKTARGNVLPTTQRDAFRWFRGDGRGSRPRAGCRRPQSSSASRATGPAQIRPRIWLAGRGPPGRCP